MVGLSGGVDSGVSAALLKKEGFDVTGVFIKIQIPGYPCPATEDRIEAMRVAAHLRIPFIEIDLSEVYQKEVLKLSLKEFERGRTPNPDVLCNREIKFGKFFEFARAHGADFVATGHYAQIKNGQLYVSVDREKDQSYFLWAVPETTLRYTLFPVGGLAKPQVRALAKKFGLPNAVRPDSQGLCFLGDITLSDMLVKEVAHSSGDVLHESGAVIGSHLGVPLYTLGQRHGFTLFIKNSEMEAHYVIAKDLARNTITVSTSKFPEHAHTTEVLLSDTNWIGEVAGGPCEARYRYRQKLIPAVLTKDAKGASVTLLEPQYVPLGQSLVLYRGERALGGGVIEDAKILS
ncbi:MAG: tRNA (5-methylaminomethyl-2-thiouridylate)-methyltransferase [Parcubacteria group bacterium Gr01-1014_56]|nr:MAG: tRNA (5-methylaminomethyl-2-thiouridylate)-methyltransferase [Parcubacteria group bacterium Gr01-1014_56]